MVINKDGLITENQNTQDNEIVTPEIEKTDNALENNFDLKSNLEIIKEDNIDTTNNTEQDITIDNSVIDENSEKEEAIEPNCLALTVRKDYNLSIIKNSFLTTLRVSWKVALSTFVLNILKLFF